MAYQIQFNTITVGAAERGPAWAGSIHRIVVLEETETHFKGWPDPTDPRCSEHWRPGVDRPMLYSKNAWVRHPDRTEVR